MIFYLFKQNKDMRKILKFFIIGLSIIIAAFTFFLCYATFTDYQPEEKIVIADNSQNPSYLQIDSSISITTWNIGYCGLNAEMDFFYDGGVNVRPEKRVLESNIKKLIENLDKLAKSDFILFQEVDRKSKRSYYTDQLDTIVKYTEHYFPYYAKNYDVFHVPLPISNPMGMVQSGLLTMSKFLPKNSIRYSFPGNYAWPKKIFMLDRCFLVNRYYLPLDKQLLVINTHNSAFDDGSLRKQQMEYLREFILAEYKSGNYVVVGGDWNQCPPESPKDFDDYHFDKENFMPIEHAYLPEDWNWAFDEKLPTSRRTDSPYEKDKSKTTLLDFYLVSPNIEVVSVKTINLEFEISDHQPVEMKFILKTSK